MSNKTGLVVNMLSIFKVKQLEKKQKQAKNTVSLLEYDSKTVSGLAVKDAIKNYHYMTILIRNTECTDDKLFAIISGVSLWNKEELTEVNGHYYIIKDQFINAFDVQDKLYTKRAYNNHCIIDAQHAIKTVFIGLSHVYKTCIIQNDTDELGIYFELYKISN